MNEPKLEEAAMDQAQIDRIARSLYRISDNQERDEVTRQVAQVLSVAEPSFD